ncbi:dephospho-CoA kinase [Legionella londiniensis]|uniref:Dephospho-CoA kinase n=1 Tax=Legionella londiniensis TaxID=45068 RepID=A0A0W0VKP7_9GAMM|nr:dephospho-CoA kinase [Legionella londiniensis]KTD20684.1 dephospho-CoA kinase [Legionella londiniensis]STX92844.1 dephospho-CoA kinase [Legionella londiniensis]
MYTIALTGNIASGKSTVARQFAKLGITIIDADQISKELTSKNQPAAKEIVQHFGRSVLNESGEINRAELRKIIFNYPQERKWLEELLHPLIRKEIKQQVQTAQGPYCIIEIPLLPKRSDYPYLNRILFIKAPKDLQLKRIEKRDHCPKEEALKILQAQACEEKHLAHADDVLHNDGSLEELRMKVINLHAKYLKFAEGA